MNEDYSVRHFTQLSQREIFHLLRGCSPTIKHHLKVLASVQGISMAQYVNNALLQHFEEIKKAAK